MSRFIRVLSVILCCALIVTLSGSLTIPVSASTPVEGVDMTLNYWLSDASTIGYWTDSTLSFYITANSSWSALSKSKMSSYLSTAFNSWSLTGKNFSVTSSQSSADVILQSITRTDALNRGFASNVLGYASITNLINTCYGYYRSSEKTVNRFLSATVYLIEYGTESTGTNYRNIFVHEMGHAFGYIGHYAFGSVMSLCYSAISSTTPNTNEENHLGQVY